MSFMIGLVLGLVAGAVVGARYPGGPGEELGQILRMLPADLQEAAQRVQNDLTARLRRAQGAFREARDETREQLQRELETARSK